MEFMQMFTCQTTYAWYGTYVTTSYFTAIHEIAMRYVYFCAYAFTHLSTYTLKILHTLQIQTHKGIDAPYNTV